MRISHLAFTPTRGSRTGIIRGPRLSVKGLRVVPPFHVQGRRPRGAPGRMFFHHSSSQWQPIIHLPVELIIDNVSVSISVFFVSLTNQDVQLRASRKESCLTEFKVGGKRQFGNNLVFPMGRFHRTFLSGEKVIGWNVCQTHSKLVCC